MVAFGTIPPPPHPSPTRGEGETRLPPPPGGREKQGSLPHQGAGRNKAPSPTRGEGETTHPPPLWGRVGVGGKGKNVQSPRAQYTTPGRTTGGLTPPARQSATGGVTPPARLCLCPSLLHPVYARSLSHRMRA